MVCGFIKLHWGRIVLLLEDPWNQSTQGHSNQKIAADMLGYRGQRQGFAPNWRVAEDYIATAKRERSSHPLLKSLLRAGVDLGFRV